MNSMLLELSAVLGDRSGVCGGGANSVQEPGCEGFLEQTLVWVVHPCLPCVRAQAGRCVCLGRARACEGPLVLQPKQKGTS